MDIEKIFDALVERGVTLKRDTLEWSCGCAQILMPRPPRAIPGYEGMQTGWILAPCDAHRHILSDIVFAETAGAKTESKF